MKNLKFKLCGCGSIYKYYLENKDLHQKNLLVITSNDIVEINHFLQENIEYPYKIVYSELDESDIDKLYTHHLVLAYINGDVSNRPFVIYTGNKNIADYIIKLTDNYIFLTNAYEAAIINGSITGIHFTYLLANLTGAVLCKKYDVDFNLYNSLVKDSTPKLCEGAFRNIWKGLASNNTFEDINDDIHAMEMLVCNMKKSNGSNLIFNNKEQQVILNNLLSNYWSSISKETNHE